MLNTIWAHVYYICLLACCGYAILRGAGSEYIGAAIMIIGSLSSLAVGKVLGTHWTSMEVEVFAIDVAGLFALIGLTIKSDRFWPIWATAFQLLAVTVHTAMMVDPEITPWAFATGAVFWAYPMLLALAIGSCEHVSLERGRKIESG
ncbi:MAG: M20 family metallo-hydrolase [Sphingomonadales bacterium]|nr:M20 family metallo-hydrolase [Sphingomonadales bacterium]PIX67297.1 MAG: hypothetical protein COZ43_02255 [Sphingomonadales bacterium CG_4_10_14_3_um_filter_58_15]NCO49657.1 M20 family metallo-hydrolase [Sphingomonadales bacterium]NCP01428.1 M20 family metallo-hydrolase [Sphingomonadales bacterium]NCP26678.1 M20 family metallo-hydrolase [Sphingomonadales bacterium]